MNRERVQMLRDMMEGVPEERINLQSRYTIRPAQWPIVDCRTIACIGGWAQLYPPFIAMGITNDWDAFFGMFNKRGFVKHGLFFSGQPNERGTDKKIALRRLDALLKS